MKKILFSLICLVIVAMSTAYAAEVSEKPIYFNGEPMEFANPTLSEKGCIIVPIRELSERAGFNVQWNGENRSVIAHNDEISVTMYIDDTNIKVLSVDGEDKDVVAILPPAIINSVTYIPLRVVSEAFGAEVKWDSETDTVYIYMERKKEDEEAEEPEEAEEELAGNTFYSQYDPQYIELYSEEPYRWTSGRNGYCYVTAYAMLLSDITKSAVTPKEVADVNLEKCGNASYCYHGDIVSKFGCRLVQALASDSLYFKEYDAGRGLTMIDNTTPETVAAAIREAIDAHPEGVLVRDSSMPHTMVAIGYDEDEIYFNDPALLKGNVTWSETCLKNKELTTITAISAIESR